MSVLERELCNHSRRELEEHRLAHSPYRLVVYSCRLPEHLLGDALFINGFMPKFYHRLRQIIEDLYGTDIVGSFVIKHGRVKAQFYTSTARMYNVHRVELGRVAELRWPGPERKQQRKDYVEHNFDNLASGNIVDGYIRLASGVFDAVLVPLYWDYLDRALEMLSPEEHMIYDEVLLTLFPKPAKSEEAEADAKVTTKSPVIQARRDERKKERKERKKRGRERAKEPGRKRGVK